MIAWAEIKIGKNKMKRKNSFDFIAGKLELSYSKNYAKEENRIKNLDLWQEIIS
jgi:hypothetical protein